MKEKRTKIIATIGPGSENFSTLFTMAKAGMDACRLNFSHGTQKSFSAIINRIRLASKKLGKPIGIIQDLMGRKLRIGKLQEERRLHQGDIVIFSANHVGEDEIPLSSHILPKIIEENDPIFLDDGRIELVTLSKNPPKIRAKVITGGVLQSFKGMNVPKTFFQSSPLTRKDREDIDFGIKHGVDFMALSFVEHEEDIQALRKVLAKKGASKIQVIAKIERPSALERLEEIIKIADAVMVARGDLGIELPPEMIPIYQKKIIHLANTYGKPVIVATQMFASMVKNPRPTRAEISDAANAVFDHADCLMLSNETSIGKYPVKSVAMLSRVALATELELQKHPFLLSMKSHNDLPLTNATCVSAVKLASDIRAKYIVALTKTGYTAREVAKHRPASPILVFTPDVSTARQLTLVWGVTESFVTQVDFQNPLPIVKKCLLQKHLVKKGDEIVIVNVGFSQKEKILSALRL